MSKKIICLLLFTLTWAINLFSQDENLMKLQNEELFFSFRQSTPEMVKFVNGVEGKRVLNYDRELLKQYPDTLKNPEKIKFVSVGYYSAEELEKNIDALQLFPNLEYLEIKTAVQFRKSDNKDTLIIPEGLNQLPKLKYLQLSGTYQVDYDDLFLRLLSLPSLEYLGMPHTLKKVQLPQNLLKLNHLKGIKISGFKEFLFPDEMGAMSSLESIVLPTEPYENLSEELLKFSGLPALKNLALGYAKFNTEDLRQIRELSELEKLYLSIFEIDDVQDLVDNISQENNLKELRLENLKSNKGISDYSKLRHLEKLHISTYPGYRISLPESLYNLEHLKSLSVHTDSLFSLSEKLGNLKNLEELKLSYNGITSLPEQIGELAKLKHLELSNNDISSLPWTISQLTALQTLNIATNSLTELPVDFGNLSSLNSLGLQSNKLAELPASFEKLSNLEFLHLNANYLQDLPEDFGNLGSLIQLNLDDNFLKRLPASFSQLEELRSLHLSFNNLQDLPEDFGDLEALEELYLGGNKNNSKPSVYHVNSGFKVDDTRPVRLFNEIRSFPNSFSRLANLKKVYLRQMTTLDEEELFEIFFEIPSINYQLDISKTGISNLPQKGWNNFLAGSLNMGGNVISNVPSDIVNAPYLSNFSFKLSENDGLSYHLGGKAELFAFFEDRGFIDFKSLPETEEMAKAYLDNAYSQKYTEANNILELINKAFLLDSTYSENNIRSSDYADALLKAGDFKRAIKYYDRAIERDTAQGPYILNFIHPNFQNRAKAHLGAGDTLAAIEGLEYVSERFNSGDWTKAALLAGAIGMDSLATSYFKNAEEFYKNHMRSNLEAERVDYGYQLSLLELYIVQEDLSKAEQYLELLKEEQISQKDKQLLLEYLEQLVAILQDEAQEVELNRLAEQIFAAKIKISSWSFDLVNTWLEISNINGTKTEKIRNLTLAMENAN